MSQSYAKPKALRARDNRLVRVTNSKGKEQLQVEDSAVDRLDRIVELLEEISLKLEAILTE